MDKETKILTFALVMGVMGCTCYFLAGAEAEFNQNSVIGAIIGTMAMICSIGAFRKIKPS